MSKWFFFIVVPILLLIIFGIIYYIDNPFDKANTSVHSPYFLSVKPAVVGIGEIINISFYSVKNHINPNDFTIFILSPDGNKFSIRSYKSQITYPNDFVNATNHLTGNYSIYAISKLNENVTMKVGFNIVTYPLLSAISNFVFSNGIAISFGLVGIIISILYQFISQRYQDRVRRSENKSRLMLENLKYYTNLQRDIWNICKKYRFRYSIL